MLLSLRHVGGQDDHQRNHDPYTRGSIAMPDMVDSNVIFDVTNTDPVWADWSDRQIIYCEPGGLLINPLIYTELCTTASTTDDVDSM